MLRYLLVTQMGVSSFFPLYMVHRMPEFQWVSTPRGFPWWTICSMWDVAICLIRWCRRFISTNASAASRESVLVRFQHDTVHVCVFWWGSEFFLVLWNRMKNLLGRLWISQQKTSSAQRWVRDGIPGSRGHCWEWCHRFFRLPLTTLQHYQCQWHVQ